MVNDHWSIGSRWLRCDPHLHTPGTLRNNQFGNDWDGYIQRIEGAVPAADALGITDYFTLRGYKEIVRRRAAGALQKVPLIFPNIELRLTIETKTRQGVNLHLLVCPDDPDHITKAEERLSRLLFRYRGESFPCTDHGLIRLGRTHSGNNSLADEVAIQEGANQFKIEFSDIRRLFYEDEWAQDNILVAIAAGNDGLSGIAKDSGFHAQREELGRFAHIVFSAQPSDRSYWLGHHPDFAENGHTPKPCLHGCDAHEMDAILVPSLDRLCWIRSEPTFDGFRQTLLEPERRTYIGVSSPPSPHAADVIRAAVFKNAPWIENKVVILNEGMVTIIGAKGSGKTAFADLLAFAADASEADPGPASFIAKAGNLVDNLEIELVWGNGSRQSATLPGEWTDTTQPRVRYLSQQFVERLCTPGGLAEPLLEEIERVVFSAIPEEDRLECTAFEELREVSLEGPVAEQEGERRAIAAKTKLIAEEGKLSKSVPGLTTKLTEIERERKALEADLKAIPTNTSDAKVKAHQGAAQKLQKLKEGIAKAERRAQEVRDVKAEIQRHVRDAENAINDLKGRHPLLLDDVLWDGLKLRVDPTALTELDRIEKESREQAASLRNPGIPVGAKPDAHAAVGLAALTAEVDNLVKELGLDQANSNRRVEFEKRLGVVKANEEKARKELDHAQKAPERTKAAVADRLARYEAVFVALEKEKQALEQLYAPLRDRVAADPRLAKLSFVVERVVNIGEWTKRGENLLDLRKPPFSGHGELAKTARRCLLPAWKNGTPEEARAAMAKFMEDHGRVAADALAQGATLLDLGEWLFSTHHIKVRYGIQYEEVEISNLSPGTRGVVLLTLYLGLDEWDLRPLIIDQPEENLDPQSVYSDLVPFFRDAARRRQIIMVTHNANLVVNTDSDQVIVASAQRRSPTALPHVTYTAGGLEDPEIRAHVCNLLEGGKDAFRKRGQRYGVER